MTPKVTKRSTFRRLNYNCRSSVKCCKLHL